MTTGHPGRAYERITAALQALELRGQYRDDKAQVQCPAHEDRNPSLSITRTDNKTLIHCHSGCQTPDILAALNLHTSDLFDYDRMQWDYTNPDTGDIYRTVSRNGDKQYRQTVNDTQPRLLNLDKIRKAREQGEPVYLVEGEKDTDTLGWLGHHATTAPMGAGNFNKVDTTPLTGLDVIAIVDRDDAGAGWAHAVQQSVAPVANSLTFKTARTGKDITDHTAAGHHIEDLEDYNPKTEPTPEYDTETDRRYLGFRSALLPHEGLAHIKPPAALIDGWLYQNSLAWLSGKPGDGKSFIALDMAYSVATGTPWQGHPTHQGTVLYIAAEGATGLSIRANAWTATHGDPDYIPIWYLPLAPNLTDTLEVDVQALQQILQDIQPTLVIIDTQARVTTGAEENSSKDMGRFVDALEYLRATNHATYLTVHHTPRNGDNLRGSTALEGAADTVLRSVKEGEILTLECKKQKNAAPADDLQLYMQQHGESIYLDITPTGVIDFSTPSQDQLLKALSELYGSDEVSNTELLKVAAGRNVSETSYYEALRRLVNRGKVIKTKRGRTTSYRLATP